MQTDIKGGEIRVYIHPKWGRFMCDTRLSVHPSSPLLLCHASQQVCWRSQMRGRRRKMLSTLISQEIHLAWLLACPPLLLLIVSCTCMYITCRVYRRSKASHTSDVVMLRISVSSELNKTLKKAKALCKVLVLWYTASCVIQ